MSRYIVRIRGTINDTVEAEGADEDEAREAAIEAWRYVEFEDIEATIVKEVTT